MIWNLTVPQHRRKRHVRKKKKKKTEITSKSTISDDTIVEDREAEMLLRHAAENLESLRSKQLSELPDSPEPEPPHSTIKAEMLLMHAAENLESLRSKQLSSHEHPSPSLEPTNPTAHKRKRSFGSWFSNVFSSSSSKEKEEEEEEEETPSNDEEEEECDIDRTDESATSAMNKMVISIPIEENIILPSSPTLHSKEEKIPPIVPPPPAQRYVKLEGTLCEQLRRAKLATAHVMRSLSPVSSEIRTRFESSCDKCYCGKCENDNKNMTNSEWCELGLHMDSRTYIEGKDVFNKWNVAFHGFPHKHLVSIVLNGLAFPGDRIKVGDEFVRVKKPQGHSRDHTAKSNIFMSPSIHCAGCPLVYAIPLRIDNFESAGDTIWVQFAMKLRVDPKCYTKRANNIDTRLWPRNMPFDENIPNSEIEWFTDTRNCVVSSALMVRVSKTNPIEDTRVRIAMYKSLHPTTTTTTTTTSTNTQQQQQDDDEDEMIIVEEEEEEEKKKKNMFFGILRKKASQHLEKMLSSLQEMYSKTKEGGADQGKFVKEMCRMMGPDVLGEVLDEVELKKQQQDDDEEDELQKPPTPPPRPSPESFLGLFQNVNKRDETGSSALHWAASRGEVSTMRMLLRAGADVKAVDASGKTALHLLCRTGGDISGSSSSSSSGGSSSSSSGRGEKIPVGEKRHHCSFIEENFDMEPLQKKLRRGDVQVTKQSLVRRRSLTM